MNLRNILPLLLPLILGAPLIHAGPIEDARKLAETRQFPEALELLETALKNASTEKPLIAAELARTQASAGLLISAQQTTERTLRENPNHPAKTSLLLLNARLLEAAGNLPEAASLYRNLAELTPPAPEKADALADCIRAASAMNNPSLLERCLADFTESFPQDPRSREFLHQLFRMRLSANNYRAAAESALLFKTAFPADPASSAIYAFPLLAQAGDHAAAVKAFQQEKDLPTFVHSPQRTALAIEAMRQSKEKDAHALILPLANEYAQLTGDPQFQIAALETLPDLSPDFIPSTLELARKLIPTLSKTNWRNRLRTALAAALFKSKDFAACEKETELVLADDPTHSTAWDLHLNAVTADKRPDAHDKLLTKALASIATLKNQSQQIVARSLITARLAQAAARSKELEKTLKYSLDFLEKDGLSNGSESVVKAAADAAFDGLAAATKARDDAEGALQTAKSAANKAADVAKKNLPTAEKEAAQKAQAAATATLDDATKKAAAAQTQLDSVKTRSISAFDKIVAALEKFLARCPAAVSSAPTFEAHFKPYLTSTTKAASPESKRLAQAIQQGSRSDIPGIAALYSDRAAGNWAKCAKAAEPILQRVLEKGGLTAFETAPHIIAIYANAGLWEKSTEASKSFLAKFPSATHALSNLTQAALQLGAPKNRDAVSLLNATLTKATSLWPLPTTTAIYDEAIAIAEQNRLPSEMESQLKALSAALPNHSSLPELQRRIGVAHAATGDVANAKKHLALALEQSRKLHAESNIILSMAIAMPEEHSTILPLIQTQLANPKRGPLQTSLLLQKAQLLAAANKEAEAIAILPAIVERKTDLSWRSSPNPTPLLEKLAKDLVTKTPEDFTPADLATLESAITLGSLPNHLPALALRHAQQHQPLDAARTIARIIAATSPNDPGSVSSFTSLAQKIDESGFPELAGLTLRQTINRATGVDPKLRAQASQALFSLSSKRKFAAVEIDEKLEWSPLLKSAVSLRMGDPSSAWKTFESNEALLAKHEDKLPADYLRWLSDRLIQREDETSRTTAEKILRRWIIANEASKSVPEDEKAKTQLQLADLYFKSLRYDLARAESASLIERFPNTAEATDAQFRIGECYLNQKMYIDAAKIFERLAKAKDKMTASRGEFLLGALAQQRGDTEDAKARFRNVMDLAPRSDVADAILFRLSELYGQENRFRDELMLLRSIGLIGSSAKQWHTPGLPLNVVIQDADLGVSRGQSHVPVTVTTSSGDTESLKLESGSAGKGFFQAELPTELGTPKPGDGILQVNGTDSVHYDYPEDFKKQFTSAIPPKANIRIAADADFRVSATEIKEEEEIPFEERLRQQRQRANRQAGIEFRQDFRKASDLKPGNLIYLQVKDADRDVSNEKDTVKVLVTSVSGSSATATLTETEIHSGLFRGTLNTVEIPADIFASDRAINGEAVRAIDGNPKTAWEALGDGRSPKSLVLDLKEKTALGNLLWQNDPAFKDKLPLEYAIQSSDDLNTWKTVAATKKFSTTNPELQSRIETTTQGNAVNAAINLKGTEARYVRMLIEKYSGTAPRIAELRMQNPEGGALVPRSSDTPATATAANADGLRLTPSDRITATYDDEVNIASLGKPRALSQQLQATYYNAKLDFIAYEFSAANGQNIPDRLIKQVRRVAPGQRFVVRITDYDADASEDRDKVQFTLKTADGSIEKTLEAIETEPFSGVFTKEVDVWSEERPDGLKLTPGILLEATYEDRQNTDPGAPVKRLASLEAAATAEPRIAFVRSTMSTDKTGREHLEFTSSLQTEAPPIKTVAFRPPLTIEVVHPTVARDSFSEITINLTTSGGASLDVICPVAEVPGSKPNGKPGTDTALDAGRFIGQVFMQLGDKDSPTTTVLEPGDTRTLVPRRNPANRQEQALANVVPVLNLNGQDIITVTYTVEGKTYTDQARLLVPASAAFTDSTYDKPVESLYIGDKVFLSVKDLTADATPERDSITVSITTERGERFSATLLETLGHSGEFTGSFTLHPGEKPTPDDDRLEAWFGDPVHLLYKPASADAQPAERTVNVVKGTDGNLLVFEKKFASEKVAIESQFRMAEAFFELFKNYRAVKQETLSNQALNDGMQILKELRRDYPSKLYEARTDYLLGQFSQELKNYDDAVAHYKRIVQNHPESPLAPDAQYKLGQCHEERNDMESASAEYVSLAYTWPDSPLVANVIVRIAEYFYTRKEFPTAAEVAKKFVERFPQHDWAERMLFRAAQCWFKADQFAKAGTEFDLLVENYPRSTFRPDALFWSGESYRSGGQLETAYRRYKRTTWDYPESEAAKYARGKLITQEMVNIADRDTQPQ
jgi:TolA-binding protein